VPFRGAGDDCFERRLLGIDWGKPASTARRWHSTAGKTRAETVEACLINGKYRGCIIELAIGQKVCPDCNSIVKTDPAGEAYCNCSRPWNRENTFPKKQRTPADARHRGADRFLASIAY
jgi:hypothetical protein